MYKVSWLIRNKVLHIHAEGDVTTNEIRSALSMMHVMLVGVDNTVHCVIDSQKVNKSPLNISLIPQKPEYTGWSIEVNDNPIAHKLGNMMTRFMTGREIKTLPSIDEALTFLQTMDVSLEQYRQAGV